MAGEPAHCAVQSHGARDGHGQDREDDDLGRGRGRGARGGARDGPRACRRGRGARGGARGRERGALGRGREARDHQDGELSDFDWLSPATMFVVCVRVCVCVRFILQ